MPRVVCSKCLRAYTAHVDPKKEAGAVKVKSTSSGQSSHKCPFCKAVNRY